MKVGYYMFNIKRFTHLSWLLVSLLLISTLLACGSNDNKESEAKGFTATEKEKTAAAKPAGSPEVRRTPTKNIEAKNVPMNFKFPEKLYQYKGYTSQSFKKNYN